MAKKGPYKSKKNQRRNKNLFLRKLLSTLLIAGAIVAALVIFFRVEEIRVEGNDVYETQDIIDASHIELGANLFLLNKIEIARSIGQQLPYIRSVSIQRDLPSTLVIHITEASPALQITVNDRKFLVSAQGKVLEEVTDSEEEYAYAVMEGCTILMPSVAETIKTSVEETERRDALISILETAEKENMLDKLEKIDLSSTEQITVSYDHRFTVRIPWDSDYSYKIRYLNKVVLQLEANESGTIDLMQEDRAHFIPYREETNQTEGQTSATEEATT